MIVERYVSPAGWAKRRFQFCSCSCRGKAERNQPKPETRREGNPNWRGGKYINAQGYVLIYRPDHPHVASNGYVMEHREVMERALGRYLLPTEVVHHINSDRADNRPENLQLFSTHSEHLRFEKAQRRSSRGYLETAS